MKVEWSPRAIDDLRQVRADVAKAEPAAAARMVDHIRRHVNVSLAAFPLSGRPGRVVGTREAVVPNTPYIVPYQLHEGALIVLRVYHAQRLWPDAF